MPNIRRYMPIHRGDNEWLSNPPESGNEEEWNEAWEELRKDCPHQIEFTEDFYNNSEYGETPEWLDVCIDDSMILQMKMARGIIRSLEGAHSIVFTSGFDLNVEDSWGGIGFEKISILANAAFASIYAKHGSEEVEVDISEQFNQAIGEV